MRLLNSHKISGLLTLLVAVPIVASSAIARAQATESAAAGAEPPPAVESTPPAGVVPVATTPAVPPSTSPRAQIHVAQPERQPEPCPPKEEEPSDGAGTFFIGAGAFDFAALNRRLRANGYDDIESPITLLGGEGRAVFPSGFVAGAHGGALLSPDGRGPRGLQRTFGGGFGMIDLGLVLVRTRPLLVTLTSGIGGYGLSLGISDGQSAGFDDVLQDPQRSSSLGRGGLLVGLTLGVDGRVPIGRVERGRQGFFTLGGRFGALYGPPLGSWSLSEGGSASAGPGRGLVGAYAALAIGFGGGSVSATRPE